MRIVWDEAKRRANLRKHGFDFADAEAVLSGITHVFEDDRFAYNERRFITLGLLKDTVVYIVHTDDAGDIRVISMRKATRYEEGLFFRNI
jgi:uncharacterized DUF497 family protein